MRITILDHEGEWGGRAQPEESAKVRTRAYVRPVHCNIDHSATLTDSVLKWFWGLQNIKVKNSHPPLWQSVDMSTRIHPPPPRRRCRHDYMRSTNAVAFSLDVALFVRTMRFGRVSWQ